jgi:hypothetical protein
MSYATLAEFKAYLKIPAATTGEDTLLQTFLDEASGIFDEVIGRPSAASADATRAYDAEADVEGARLMFGRADVACAITAVVNGDGATIPPAAYVTEPRNERPYWGLTLKANSGYEWRAAASGPEGAISVTAKWAYTTNADGSADRVISGATLQLAAWLYRSKDQVTELSRPVKTADGVTILPLALPKSVLDRVMSRRSLI